MRRPAKLVTVMVALSVTCAFAADWPWIYGPARNSTSNQKGLLRTWPQEGPKVLWTAPVGLGFGGAAVSAGKVYLLDRDEKVGDNAARLRPGQREGALELRVRRARHVHVRRVAHDADAWMATTSTPADRWATCTPSTRRRARPVWHKNIWKDFGGGELPRWAIVQHPLIYGDLLIVAPQTPQAGVVAYDKLTGRAEVEVGAAVRPSGLCQPVHRQDRRARITWSWSMASVGRGRTARDGSVNGLDPLHRQSAVDVLGLAVSRSPFLSPSTPATAACS